MASSFTLGIQQVKNGKNSGDVCIRFVIKKYIIPTLKSFIPSFFLLAVFVARGNAQSIESFSNFEDVTQTFYHEVTGRPYLNFSYAKISKEYRKFKFLKFGLPNFIVHGLKVQFDLVSYDHAQILRKLSDFEKKICPAFCSGTGFKSEIQSPSKSNPPPGCKNIENRELWEFSGRRGRAYYSG